MTGVLDYRFDNYAVQPTQDATHAAADVRPESHGVESPLTAASMNVLNYFTTLQTEDPDARGAVTAEDLQRQQDKIVAALAGIDADPEDPDGQGNCNGVRTHAARALADWMETDEVLAAVDKSLIIGDLNAYAKEYPITALTEVGYVDTVAQFNGDEAYTYVFDGQLGYLDHALASGAMAPLVTDVEEWHINADEPDLLDYTTEFKKPAQQEIYAPDEFRSSDHDPVVVGLDLSGEGGGDDEPGDGGDDDEVSGGSLGSFLGRLAQAEPSAGPAPSYLMNGM